MGLVESLGSICRQLVTSAEECWEGTLPVFQIIYAGIQLIAG